MGKVYDAARRGDAAKVVALLDRGGDPNDVGDEHGTTALTAAAFLGHVEVVRVLLAHGADVNRPNKHGSRPLFTAIRNAKVRVISMLLDAGAALDVEAAGGVTPLAEAAQSTPETLRLLLRRGVDVNASSSDGWTALHAAAIDALNGPTNLRLLLDAGADPTRRDDKGRTARDMAQERGRPENVAILDEYLAARGT